MTIAAYEHNGCAVGSAQFYAIACDPRRHVVVEACAGAGKTWVLVSRILRALLDGAQPQEILAITFTRKAAGEMRQRLQEWLADFARPQPADPARGRPAETPAQWAERLQRALHERGIDPGPASSLAVKLQHLYQNLLAHPRPLQIRTFHGWFATLLGSAPLALLDELGLPAAYELLEDTSDALAELWRRYLALLAHDPALRADYAELVAQLGQARAHQALEAALDKRVEFALADAAGTLEEGVAAFDAVYPRLAGVAHPTDWLLQRAPGRALLHDAAQALAPLARTFAAKGAELTQALQAGDWAGVVAALFTQALTPRAFGKNPPQAVRDAQHEVELILAACHQHDARQHHQRLLRLLRPMIDAFATLKRERGWVDMGDIERAALRLLSDPFLSGWVQERLDARVRHLLIDEFQDTSPLQWQALHAWLSSYAGAGGRTPSVFIVGDPKQSIYRFRRADPRVFRAAQDFIVQGLGGDRLACDHTRRNAPAVLQAVNAVLGQAQTDGQFDGFRPHTTQSDDGAGQILALPLIPRPERAARPSADADTDTDAAPWRDSLGTPRVEVEDSLRRLESRQLAQWIAARIASGVPPTEIMVLSRRREPLGVLQAELRHLGVPCEQPEKQLLADLPVVQDMLALVDALISPGHDLALARALKSPLFGASDHTLTRLAQAARAAAPARPAWLDLLSNAELQAEIRPRLHADLMQYQQWLLQLPPHDALQAIYQHGDVLARFAAAAPPADRAHTLVQLRALLAAALQLRGGRFLTAYQWVRALRRQSLAAPRHAAPDSVRLLTVHGAKGLEADHVVLLNSAAASEARQGGPAVLIDWPGAAAAPQRLVMLANDHAPPPSLTELAASEATASAREELNALYVAMTRARRQLVLSGVTPGRATPGSWWERIAPLAQPVEQPTGAAEDEAGPAAAPQPADPATFELIELPAAPAAPETVPATLAAAQGADPAASAAARLGEAMHWLLEHAGDTAQGWLPQRLAQVVRRFGVTSGQAAQADALARRILHGEAAWAWRPDAIVQALDEAELLHQGQRLRIDRLVRRRAHADQPECWWVLDYKSAAHPERDPTLQQQLHRYRSAVQAAHPDMLVQAAFVTGEGRLILIA